jgi:hypothetical protein
MAAGPLPAQPPPEVELAQTVVKTLSDKDLPVGMRLSTFVSQIDKEARNEPGFLKQFLRGLGLTTTDEDLELLTSLYGDFDEDQGARGRKMLHELAGQPKKIDRAGNAFLIERRGFTGGVLGAWLAHLRDEGQDTDHFLARIADSYSVSAFWETGPPTMEGLEEQAEAFEESFRREYGVPLQAVLQRGPQGGGR